MIQNDINICTSYTISKHKYKKNKVIPNIKTINNKILTITYFFTMEEITKSRCVCFELT